MGRVLRTSAAVVPLANTTPGRWCAISSVYRRNSSEAWSMVTMPRSHDVGVLPPVADADGLCRGFFPLAAVFVVDRRGGGGGGDGGGGTIRLGKLSLLAGHDHWRRRRRRRRRRQRWLLLREGRALGGGLCDGLVAGRLQVCPSGHEAAAGERRGARVARALALVPGVVGGGVAGRAAGACRLAVSASIFFSSSATRLSVFFWRLRVGCVTTQLRPALAHRLHGPSGLAGSGSHRTLSPRQASQARGFFGSAAADPAATAASTSPPPAAAAAPAPAPAAGATGCAALRRAAAAAVAGALAASRARRWGSSPRPGRPTRPSRSLMRPPSTTPSPRAAGPAWRRPLTTHA